MEPLSNNDPLLKLLGKARPVEPRPNFTQNVMRAIRQTPQSQSLWERVQEWLGAFTMPRMAFAAAAVVILLAVVFVQRPAPQTAPVAVAPQTATQPHLTAVVDEMLFSATETVATPDIGEAQDLSGMGPMGLLLVHEDTSALTDSEIALLVY